jgi:hypothetical protein
MMTKMLGVLMLAVIGIQVTASAQGIEKQDPAASNWVTAAAGQADQEYQSSVRNAVETHDELEKSLSRTLPAAFLGVQESDRIRLLASHLDALVELGEDVLSKQAMVRQAVVRLMSATKDAPPKLRAAEAHFQKLAAQTPYPHVKELYLGVADWYRVRSERIERQPKIDRSRDPEAEIDQIRAVVVSLRELQAAIKVDPLFLDKVDPSFQRKLHTLLAFYDELPKTLRAWSDDLMKGVAPEIKAPDRPSPSGDVPPSPTAPPSTPAAAPSRVANSEAADPYGERILLIAATTVGGLITRWLRR